MTDIITNLHPDGDSSTNLYPNIKKENIPSKSISTDKLDDNVLSLIGSLKPSGTDTSTNILAYTSNKGIYVATDNGHWYYWNGSAYTDGGFYQATEIAFNSVDIDKLTDDISNNFESINLFDNSKIISGGYYSSTGSIEAHTNSQYSSQYIKVKNGTTYTSNIPSGVVVQFVTYDNNGAFIERINQIDKNTYTFNQNVTYIRLSVYNSTFPTQFMFCESNKYPTTYMPYKLSVILPNDNISVEETIGNKIIQNTITLSNLPKYSIIDRNCYVDSAGEKVNSDIYNSILIYAYQDFDIWYSGGTPVYLCLAKFNNAEWNTYNFVARYRNVDNNLPTSSNKLTISKGQLLIITYNNSYDINFSFDTDNLINNFTFKNTFLLNDNQIIQVGVNKVIVNKTNDNYDIYMGKYRFPFYKKIDLAKNLNSYDISDVYYNSNLIMNGNILGVVRETNQDDFMGGDAHGDEQIISMNIYCDGKPINENTSGNRVDIYLISNLQRVSDKTNVILRNVHIIFENSTMTIETNFKFLVDNIEVEVAYVGMWGQYTSYITKLFTNIDEYNVTNPTIQNNSKVYSVSYVSPNGLIDISIKKGYEYNKFKNLLFYYEDSLRIKNYFCIANYETFNTDDVLYGVTEYKFN